MKALGGNCLPILEPLSRKRSGVGVFFSSCGSSHPCMLQLGPASPLQAALIFERPQQPLLQSLARRQAENNIQKKQKKTKKPQKRKKRSSACVLGDEV